MHPRDPQHAVGKTIVAINEYGFRAEILFSDDTKLQIEPGEKTSFDDDDVQPELIFQEDLAAD